MKVTLVNPYGFCQGVLNVIKRIETIRKSHPNEDIYCIGQVVHNQIVINKLLTSKIKILAGDKQQIIDSLDHGVVIFSAHGTDEKIIAKAKQKNLIVYDAVCPFVKQELTLIKDKINQGYDVIYIGVSNHDETKAALAISNKIHFISAEKDLNNLTITNSKIIVINQTTLSILDLKKLHQEILKKYPYAILADEICNATRLRQKSIIDNANKYDGVIVIGDENSNNTKALYNLSLKKGYQSIMIKSYEKLDLQWLSNKNNILITSGTSTPNEIVIEVYEKISNL